MLRILRRSALQGTARHRPCGASSERSYIPQCSRDNYTVVRDKFCRERERESENGREIRRFRHTRGSCPTQFLTWAPPFSSPATPHLLFPTAEPITIGFQNAITSTVEEDVTLDVCVVVTSGSTAGREFLLSFSTTATSASAGESFNTHTRAHTRSLSWR